jgi:hypothetical protein
MVHLHAQQRLHTDATWNDATWRRIVESTGKAFRLTAEETKALEDKALAKLLAATPFLSGCVDAYRTAVASVGTYVLSLYVGDAAACKRSDASDVMRRIALLDNYIGGNRAIQRRALSLVALTMLWDYHNDADDDAAGGKYNPIVAGDIDFHAEVATLEQYVRENPCPEMDKIFSLEASTEGYWALDG